VVEEAVVKAVELEDMPLVVEALLL